MVLLALISRGHFAASGDALHYMVIAQSMVLDSDVDLANDYADASRILSGDPGEHAQRGRAGILRPVHDVGLPGLAAPPFAMAYWLAERTDALPDWLRERGKLNRFIALRQLMSVMMIALTVWLGVVVFDIAVRLTGRTSFAAVSAWVVAVSPPVLAHGYVFMTEVPTALIGALVVREIVTRRSAGRDRSLLLGVATGSLVLLHARNVGLVLGLAGMCAWHVRARHTSLAGYLAGCTIALAVRSAVNLHFWGTLVVSPHARVGSLDGMAWHGMA